MKRLSAIVRAVWKTKRMKRLRAIVRAVWKTLRPTPSAVAALLAFTLIAGGLWLAVAANWGWWNGDTLDDFTPKDQLAIATEQLRLDERDDRTQRGLEIATIGVGILVALYTWRRMRALEKSADIQDASLQVDRYVRAVEQLGSDKVDVRLGGIFGLEQLSLTDPPGYAANVYEVLVAYLREHTRPAAYEELTEQERTKIKNGSSQPPPIGTDVEAVLTVLARRRSLFDVHVPELAADPRRDDSGPHLVGVNLDGAWIRGADFTHASLTECQFNNATLTTCQFGDATLTECQFSNATLTECQFSNATLTTCMFYDATLTECQFNDATLTTCQFSNATLTTCWFNNATLTTCQFNDATLTKCRFSKATLTKCKFTRVSWPPDSPPIWPHGFEAPDNTWSEDDA